jgi:phosphoribosylformylglycinamidine synthase
MKARIHVTLKAGVLDPQGKAIGQALKHLGFSGVEDVRQGKYFELALEAADMQSAREELDSMCRKLLANTVIENFSIDVES